MNLDAEIFILVLGDHELENIEVGKHGSNYLRKTYN